AFPGEGSPSQEDPRLREVAEQARLELAVTRFEASLAGQQEIELVAAPAFGEGEAELVDLKAKSGALAHQWRAGLQETLGRLHHHPATLPGSERDADLRGRLAHESWWELARSRQRGAEELALADRDAARGEPEGGAHTREVHRVGLDFGAEV